MIPFLDLHKINQQHEEEILQALQRVVKSGWFLRGEETVSFEKNYAHFIGTKYAVGVGNGLDAIEMVLRAYIYMGYMNPHDEVIIPANTFLASVLAVINAGLTPVFVDAAPDTLLMDENKIESLITKRTKAIMIVHLYGKCAFSSKIKEICSKYKLLLIEDNAQAHGCKYGNQRTGSLGNAAAHSFYPGKNLGAMGDAGAVTTDDKQLAELVWQMANYGFREKYYADAPGKNTRIDEMQAALLNVKLKYLDQENVKRKHVADVYRQNMKNPWVRIPPANDQLDNVFHLFPILSERRDELQTFLLDHGVQTLIHYPVPPHKQKALPQFNQLVIPITEQISQQELSLPISPVLTDDEATCVINLINQFK